MCCFSRKVESVSGTRIFARGLPKDRELIVYSMILSTKDDVAMILPIPVAKDVKEEDVTWVNLEKYPNLFDDLEKGFKSDKNSKDSVRGPAKDDRLKVVEVGAFVASFVPKIKDFERLDEQFRLPTKVWDDLPQYKDFGFAVFQLKKGESKIHPMAFEFTRANPRQLFFPTVHIHDGKVHDKADFDHVLYCQRSPEGDALLFDWKESRQPAKLFMRCEQAKGVFLEDAHVHRLRMVGKLKNEDVIV